MEIKPSLNLKCIVFTFLLAGGYWFLPPKNKWILLFLLYIPYLLLAWYDHIYKCERNMGPTYLALFYEWAKPKGSKQIYLYQNMSEKYKTQIFSVDMIILVILIAMVPTFLDWQP